LLRSPFTFSSCARQGAALEGEADGVDGSDRSSPCGFDDGSDIGVEGGAPFAAKAVGDLAIDGAGAQRSLRAVVGRGEVAVGHEDEQMAADLLDDFLKLAAGFVGRDQAHQAVEASVQIGLVDFEGAVGQSVASAPNGAGAFEQALHARGEHRVAGVDGVLDVADEMRQTDLMLALGPAHLAAVAVRYPEIGTPFAQETLDDRLGAMFVGDKDGAVAMMEHPTDLGSATINSDGTSA